MHEEAPVVSLRPHVRLLQGMRKPHNWLQLVRFGLVGALGFAVNLVVYAILVHSLNVEYHVAAAIAWIVAVCNNFVLNRHWTFAATQDRPHGQAARFLVVSLIAFVFSQLLLTFFVEVADLSKITSQALAVGLSTPLNFIGNKLWSFRSSS